MTGGGLTNGLGFWKARYTPTSTGIPQSHKSYRPKAQASASLKLPIEAVAEYNLAGGSTGRGNYAYPQNPRINGVGSGTHLDGLEGVLRFTIREPYAPTIATYGRPHDNAASGYYNWYVLTGAYHVNYNPNTLNLQTASVVDTDGSTIPLNTKYYLPAQEDWWGVFSGRPSSINWTSTNTHLTQESFRVGGPDLPLRFTSSCSYSNPATDGSGNQIVYALRFIQPPSGTPAWGTTWYNPATGLNDITTCYPVIPDNSLVCAYRYTRVGSHSSSNLTDHVKVEVWYLGADGYNKLKTQLGGATPTGSDLAARWASPTISSSSAITRLFPTAGYYAPFSGSSAFSSPANQNDRGYYAYYWSTTEKYSSSAWYVYWDSGNVYTGSAHSKEDGLSVRPFLR